MINGDDPLVDPDGNLMEDGFFSEDDLGMPGPVRLGRARRPGKRRRTRRMEDVAFLEPPFDDYDADRFEDLEDDDWPGPLMGMHGMDEGSLDDFLDDFRVSRPPKWVAFAARSRQKRALRQAQHAASAASQTSMPVHTGPPQVLGPAPPATSLPIAANVRSQGSSSSGGSKATGANESQLDAFEALFSGNFPKAGEQLSSSSVKGAAGASQSANSSVASKPTLDEARTDKKVTSKNTPHSKTPRISSQKTEATKSAGFSSVTPLKASQPSSQTAEASKSGACTMPETSTQKTEEPKSGASTIPQISSQKAEAPKSGDSKILQTSSQKAEAPKSGNSNIPQTSAQKAEAPKSGNSNIPQTSARKAEAPKSGVSARPKPEVTKSGDSTRSQRSPLEAEVTKSVTKSASAAGKKDSDEIPTPLGAHLKPDQPDASAKDSNENRAPVATSTSKGEETTASAKCTSSPSALVAEWTAGSPAAKALPSPAMKPASMNNLAIPPNGSERSNAKALPSPAIKPASLNKFEIAANGNERVTSKNASEQSASQKDPSAEAASKVSHGDSGQVSDGTKARGSEEGGAEQSPDCQPPFESPAHIKEGAEPSPTHITEGATDRPPGERTGATEDNPHGRVYISRVQQKVERETKAREKAEAKEKAKQAKEAEREAKRKAKEDERAKARAEREAQTKAKEEERLKVLAEKEAQTKAKQEARLKAQADKEAQKEAKVREREAQQLAASSATREAHEGPKRRRGRRLAVREDSENDEAQDLPQEKAEDLPQTSRHIVRRGSQVTFLNDSDNEGAEDLSRTGREVAAAPSETNDRPPTSDALPDGSVPTTKSPTSTPRNVVTDQSRSDERSHDAAAPSDSKSDAVQIEKEVEPVPNRVQQSKTKPRAKVKAKMVAKELKIDPSSVGLRRSDRKRNAPPIIYDPSAHCRPTLRVEMNEVFTDIESDEVNEFTRNKPKHHTQFEVNDVVWFIGDENQSPWPGHITAVIQGRHSLRYDVTSFGTGGPGEVNVSPKNLMPWSGGCSQTLVNAIRAAAIRAEEDTAEGAAQASKRARSS